MLFILNYQTVQMFQIINYLKSFKYKLCLSLYKENEIYIII